MSTLNFHEAAAPPGKVLISLATYNERDNVGPLVEAIREYAPEADILIIDDNSPDGTGKVADAVRADRDGIVVVHRAGKLGLGTVILYAANSGTSPNIWNLWVSRVSI